MTHDARRTTHDALKGTLLALLLAATSDGLFAQQTGVNRTQFVFHVYVDPLRGDDARAVASNPWPSGQPQPLQNHPQPPSPGASKPVEGKLDHAPYSFKTLTAACNYAQNTLNPGINAAITYVVIECMPGMYGPISVPGLGPTDLKSGLPFNGETFPIFVPQRVCIQGASAMDTIFDARGTVTRVFEYDSPLIGIPPTGPIYENCFLDGVTIRGARSGEWPDGTGVLITFQSTELSIDITPSDSQPVAAA